MADSIISLFILLLTKSNQFNPNVNLSSDTLFKNPNKLLDLLCWTYPVEVIFPTSSLKINTAKIVIKKGLAKNKDVAVAKGIIVSEI